MAQRLSHKTETSAQKRYNVNIYEKCALIVLSRYATSDAKVTL